MDSSACLRLNSRIYDEDQESTSRGDGRWMHWLNLVLLISLPADVSTICSLFLQRLVITLRMSLVVSIHHHR